MKESTILKENSDTPKKKKYSLGVVLPKVHEKREETGKRQDDSKELKLYEEYTYTVQPFLSFIHSIHRILFFLDYNDKCILYKSIFSNLNHFLKEFFFVSKLQSKLYDLKKNLRKMSIEENFDLQEMQILEDKPEDVRKKSNTKEIVGRYNNEGIKFLPKEIIQKKITRDLNIRLEYISSFPYLLSLLVDLENLFKEIKEFFISLNKESFFEKIGILSETKLKNKKRLHRWF